MTRLITETTKSLGVPIISINSYKLSARKIGHLVHLNSIQHRAIKCVPEPEHALVAVPGVVRDQEVRVVGQQPQQGRTPTKTYRQNHYSAHQISGIWVLLLLGETGTY